jgi:DNA-binding response OmpR family regulator
VRILVVEDDESLRRYVRAALEDRGFSIDEAVCLDDATGYVEGVPYDAVVFDLGLPDGDGLSLIEIIRRARRIAGPRVDCARQRQGSRQGP